MDKPFVGHKSLFCASPHAAFRPAGAQDETDMRSRPGEMGERASAREASARNLGGRAPIGVQRRGEPHVLSG